MAYAVISGATYVIEEETPYEKLRRQKIETNTRKLESLGLLALAAAVEPATNLKM